jgi:catechol 2,3-dioxygenase-like lactoylglutathione lyase family enzyme
VRAVRLNHVSIHANDLDESERFYVELFGMERLPAPDFDPPVRWLRIGDQQLHLFHRTVEPPPYHHLALDVDDFEAFYRRAKELGVIERAFDTHVRELMNGVVQMYIRDPAGNLVEVDWPDAASLDTSVFDEFQRLEDDRPQRGDAARATLYHSRVV